MGLFCRSYSEHLLKHVIYIFGTMNPSGFYIVEGFFKTTFLFRGGFDDAHTLNCTENLFEVREDRFVLDVD